jgi:DNA-binding transcriptional ArsR family regulator
MQDDQIDLVFRAVAHPERRRILASLQDSPGQSLFDICASAFAEGVQPLSRQTVSQHLDALESAGLLEVLWKGRTKAHFAKLDPLRQAVQTALSRYL